MAVVAVAAIRLLAQIVEVVNWKSELCVDPGWLVTVVAVHSEVEQLPAVHSR